MKTATPRTSGPLGPLARARLARLSPVLVRMGPVTLTLSCMALIALLALLYLGQVGAVASANRRLQALQATQATLQRQDELAHARLGAAQDPAYIRRRAHELGLVPDPPGSITVITVPGLAASGDQSPSGTGGQP